MGKSKETWHVPFAGRTDSTVYGQNFLVQYDNVYVMNNHRAACWCWMREVDVSQPFNLVHIDRHYDCLGITEAWKAATPDVTAMSIEEYLAYKVPVNGNGGAMRLFRWDSYLSLFLHKDPEQMRQFWCATHRNGADPPVDPTDTVEPWQLPGALNYLKASDDAVDLQRRPRLFLLLDGSESRWAHSVRLLYRTVVRRPTPRQRREGYWRHYFVSKPGMLRWLGERRKDRCTGV